MPFRLPLFMACATLLAATGRAAITPGSTNLGSIWFVGDSITQGNASGETLSSIRGRVYSGLTSAGYTFDYTGYSTNKGSAGAAPAFDGLPNNGTSINNAYASHDGWSGSVISASTSTNTGGRVDMTASLNNMWTNGRLATVKPNLVLVMLGTNDIDRGATPAAAIGYYTTFFNNMYALSSFNASVLVTTIAPNHSAGQVAGATANGVTFNSLLPGMVSALQASGKDIHLVDSYTPLNNNLATAMNGDGLHPNATGDQLVANTWVSGINALTAVPEPPTYGILGAGALGVAAFVRRRNKRGSR